MRGRGGGGGCGSGLRNAVNRLTPRGSEESSTSFARLLFDVLAERETPARWNLSCHTLYSGKNYSKSDSVQAHHDFFSFFFLLPLQPQLSCTYVKAVTTRVKDIHLHFRRGGKKKKKHPITYQVLHCLQRAQILPLQRVLLPKKTQSHADAVTRQPSSTLHRALLIF